MQANRRTLQGTTDRMVRIRLDNLWKYNDRVVPETPCAGASRNPASYGHPMAKPKRVEVLSQVNFGKKLIQIFSVLTFHAT